MSKGTIMQKKERKTKTKTTSKTKVKTIKKKINILMFK